MHPTQQAKGVGDPGSRLKPNRAIPKKCFFAAAKILAK
jgi:hypothetical protein